MLGDIKTICPLHVTVRKNVSNKRTSASANWLLTPRTWHGSPDLPKTLEEMKEKKFITFSHTNVTILYFRFYHSLFAIHEQKSEAQQFYLRDEVTLQHVVPSWTIPVSNCWVYLVDFFPLCFLLRGHCYCNGKKNGKRIF